MYKTYLVVVCISLSFLITSCSKPIANPNGTSSFKNDTVTNNISLQNTSISPEEFKKRAEEMGLTETMVHSLENLDYTRLEILSLPSQSIAKIFAPGTNNDGAPAFIATDNQIDELKKVGIDVDMSVILGNLGYKYDEMLALKSDEIDFIFPNTELMANLEKKGFSKQEVQHLRDQGKTFKEIIKTALNALNENQMEPFSQGLKISQENLDLEQIAKLVFENQMQYVESPNYPDDRRIKDYKIKSIRIEEIRDAGFVFSVDYSILPATDKFILAGNGSLSDDNGWINDKFHFVEVSNIDGTYKITSMATGR